MYPRSSHLHSAISLQESVTPTSGRYSEAQPAVKCTCSDHTLRILKGNRQTEQDPDRTVRDHALRNLHSTGSENACSCKRIQRRYCSIYVEGLQLIVAILLMVLGVIIVVTSGKELLSKKAGSEARA